MHTEIEILETRETPSVLWGYLDVPVTVPSA
jgi:hypothetical protein